MKSMLLFMLLLTSLQEIKAQTISKQVIASSGQSISNGTTTLNFTVGEPLVGLVQNNATISQGFWSELFNDGTLSVNTYSETEAKIGIYPNPVVDYLKLSFKHSSETEFDVKLVDVNGKTLINRTLQANSGSTDINMTNYSSGIYLLVVMAKDNKYSKTIKILKQ